MQTATVYAVNPITGANIRFHNRGRTVSMSYALARSFILSMPHPTRWRIVVR